MLIQDQTEAVTSLRVATTASGATRSVIYSVPIVAGPGDVAMCMSAFEVTNDCGINVMVGRYMTLSGSPDGIVKNEPLIAKAATENVTPAGHHMVCNLHGMYEFTAPFEGYINVVAYAASSQAKTTHRLTVHQNYGKLDVFMLRAAQEVIS